MKANSPTRGQTMGLSMSIIISNYIITRYQHRPRPTQRLTLPTVQLKYYCREPTHDWAPSQNITGTKSMTGPPSQSIAGPDQRLGPFSKYCKNQTNDWAPSQSTAGVWAP